MTAKKLSEIAESLGLDTEVILPKKQEVVGTYLGKKAALTREGKPMFILHFLTEQGEVQTINMMASADRDVIEPGKVYAARWVGKVFEIVEGVVFPESTPTTEVSY